MEEFLLIFEGRTVLYFVFAGAAWLLALAIRRSRMEGRVIRPGIARGEDYKREIVQSLLCLVIFSLSAFIVIKGTSGGWMHLDTKGSYGVIECVVIFSLMLVVHDTYFYWTHRWFHRPGVFRHFHKTHHKSVHPTPFASYSFDLSEAVVNSAFFPLWFALVTTPAVVVQVFVLFALVRNVLGHTGVEILPRWTVDNIILDQFTTTTHHDLHHSGHFRHNYGLYFTWWDRPMKTEHPKYKQVFREVTSREHPVPAQRGTTA
ncbi:sterol desaturase family protein [Parerythrobacter lacustris]|uniref:Sterol desaturase family protein n=1 Tax=Parerythrobacter lacustris TaxID=2969984 RepID=A0ABT1XN15_9SPHN|nr:sterol desaturase family protein [Parerythrobacter lacustris]MCR2832962.1 sterol desaturase family protein [Parerythrobacter lacustris]